MEEVSIIERMIKPFIYHVTYARTHGMPQRKEINNEYAWLAPGTRPAPLWTLLHHIAEYSTLSISFFHLTIKMKSPIFS